MTEQDIPLSQLTFGAFKYSSRMVKLSISLCRIRVSDLENYLAFTLGWRIGRALNPLLTTGTGSGLAQRHTYELDGLCDGSRQQREYRWR